MLNVLDLRACSEERRWTYRDPNYVWIMAHAEIVIFAFVSKTRVIQVETYSLFSGLFLVCFPMVVYILRCMPV